MMLDGISTKNTLGHGLGAIQRLSDKFDIYTQKEKGTTILSRLYQHPLPIFNPKSDIEIKGLVVPKTGETESGVMTPIS